ncbi:MAG: hypothetical protein ACKVOM_09205 [Ferruginibacter sp.]
MRILSFILFFCIQGVYAQQRFPLVRDDYKFKVVYHCPCEKIIESSKIGFIAQRCDYQSLTEIMVPIPKSVNFNNDQTIDDFIKEVSNRPGFIQFIFVKRNPNRIHVRFLERNITHESALIIGKSFDYILVCASISKDFKPKLAKEFIQSFKELK